MYILGVWTVDNSDLNVIIHKIYYENQTYIKCKLTLINKHNGIEYERHKNYKIYTKNVDHWLRSRKNIDIN